MFEPRTLKGFQLALASVLLVSYAQLAQKWGMVQLPPVAHWAYLLADPLRYWLSLCVVFSGLGAYFASMLCWLGALGYLPLNRAYPLLGLSYGLVYVGGVMLPWYAEAFSPRGMVGVALIAAGVLLINLRRKGRS